MLIVLPSDPATRQAADFLTAHNIAHQVIPLPDTLDYKTGANLAIWLCPPVPATTLTDLSAGGHVIMRVFREFSMEETTS